MFGFLIGVPAMAQEFKPGQVIEYKLRGATPPKWERGIIIRPLEGGKQYLIHEKPSQFFPEGPEKAYYPEEIRVPQAAPKDPQPPANPKIAPNRPLVTGKGLLSRADVIAYAKQVIGPGNPFADADRRVVNLAKIRDHIKARGTSFLPDLDFKNEMWALGAYEVNINSAIEANYGKPPKLEDYFGTFLLRTTNRGTKSVTPRGTRIIITTTDAQYEAGSLTINPDGTYVWKISRTDPEEKWVKGTWRECKADEMHVWEGGPAIWLEKARQNEDYMVRMCRVPDYEGWIDVGMTKGRSPAHYGRRP
jgi:hypothetical protein